MWLESSYHLGRARATGKSSSFANSVPVASWMNEEVKRVRDAMVCAKKGRKIKQHTKKTDEFSKR